MRFDPRFLSELRFSRDVISSSSRDDNLLITLLKSFCVGFGTYVVMGHDKMPLPRSNAH